MKFRVFIVCLGVLTAPASASSVSTSRSEAHIWLRNHAGTPNELDELKGANPEAFAIVQALLTKRSLGLLNNKHPTASMTDLNKPQEEESTPGPEAFANLEAPAHQMAVESAAPKVELPYASIGHKTHNWLNWKPDSSAADEAMVSNVLGMVGGMKGGAAPPAPEAEEAPAAFSEPEAPAVPQRQVVEAAAQEAPAPVASSGWGDMFGLKKKPHHQAAPQPEEAPEEAPRAAVQHSSKQDWGAAEKSKGSADEKAVSSLLKMVAQMKGGKAAQKLLEKHHVEEDSASPLSGDLAAWGDAPEEEAAAPAVEAVAPPAPVEAAPVEAAPEVVEQRAAPVEVAAAAPEPAASGWGDIGSSMGVPAKPHHHMHMAAAAFKTVVEAPAVELPYAEAPPAHHSSAYGLNWKPPSSEADSAMVANALSMMGNKGGVSASEAPQVEAAPEPVQAPVAPAPEAEEAPQEEAPKPHGEDKDSKAVNSLLNMVAQLKGGKAAEKMLARHQKSVEHVDADEDVFSKGAAEASQPAPVAASAPASDSGWGSFGAMLGVHHKAKPVAVQQAVEAPAYGQSQEVTKVISQDWQQSSTGGMSAEVQNLVSEGASSVHHAASQAAPAHDYKHDMANKQNADDSAVKKLLSMVAQLKGGRNAEKLVQKYDTDSPAEAEVQSPLGKDEGIFGNPFGIPVEAAAPVEAAPVQLNYVEEAPVAAPIHHHHHFASLAKAASYVEPAAPVEAAPAEVAQTQMVEEVLEAPAAPARKSNKFLDSAPEPPHKIAALSENSYLKEFDLKTDSEVQQAASTEVQQAASSHATIESAATAYVADEASATNVASARANFEATATDFRSSFAKSDSSETVDFEKTWKDAADSKAQAIQQFFSKQPAKVVAAPKKKDKNLLAWLDSDQQEAPAAKPVAAAKPEVSGNPYIADLM